MVLVPQRTTVFAGTIAEAMGRHASEEQVARAAMLANADGFIQALPDGYNTVLEERGSNLSEASSSALPSPGPCWEILRCCCSMRPPALDAGGSGGSTGFEASDG